jgi:hypothetical protein
MFMSILKGYQTLHKTAKGNKLSKKEQQRLLPHQAMVLQMIRWNICNSSHTLIIRNKSAQKESKQMT